jgi:hypothetical protein
MISYFKKLENAPYKKKQRVLVISTAVITMIVVVAWMLLFQYEFGDNNLKGSIKNSVAPFKIIKQTFNNIYGSKDGGEANVNSAYSVDGATIINPLPENTQNQ